MLQMKEFSTFISSHQTNENLFFNSHNMSWFVSTLDNKAFFPFFLLFRWKSCFNIFRSCMTVLYFTPWRIYKNTQIFYFKLHLSLTLKYCIYSMSCSFLSCWYLECILILFFLVDFWLILVFLFTISKHHDIIIPLTLITIILEPKSYKWCWSVLIMMLSLCLREL